jgi:hypothetical protein
VAEKSPTLADRVAVSSETGLDNVVEQLLRVISPSPRERPDASSPRSSVTVSDSWVNMEYPRTLGLITKLEANGYELKWETANNEATAVNIDGLEYVLSDNPDGTRSRLKIHDHPAVGRHVVLLKHKRR